MKREIRLAGGMLFIAFLFLPIAQCSYTPCKEYGPELEAEEAQCIEAEEVVREITIYKGSTDDFIPFLVFIGSIIFPIGLGLANPKNTKLAIYLNATELIGSIWLAILVYSVVYWIYKPLILGHLFFTFTLSYVCFSIYGLYAHLKNP